MKPTVKNEETTHVVTLDMRDEPLFGGRNKRGVPVYANQVQIVYLASRGSWTSGRETYELSNSVMTTSDFMELHLTEQEYKSMKERLTLLADEYRPTWEPKAAQA